MKHMFFVFAVLISFLSAVPAFAQSADQSQVVQLQQSPVSAPAVAEHRIYFPGSLWTSTGSNMAPSEKDNVTFNHVEQGIAYRGAELYGSFTGEYDTKKLDWNRRTIEGVGVRFTQNVSHGIVRAGVAYLSETRYVAPKTYTGVSATVEAWFGWGRGK